MVTIWDRFLALRGVHLNLPGRVQVDADCLGTAIAEAARIFAVPIKPAWAHDKYFIVGDDRSSRDPEPGLKQREKIIAPAFRGKVFASDNAVGGSLVGVTA